MKIGSLCTGYGGLDMATEAYFNAETVWVSEIDKYASQVIEQRFGVVNHGDLKTINWAEVEPIDILTAGYPCQPFSHAGERKGLQDARHIWPYIKEAISYLRPRIVVLENVRGHLSLGFDTVLKDLAQIGYDAKWQIVRAADVGAPHHRARLFVIAYPTSQGLQRDRWQERRIGSEIATDTDNPGRIGNMSGLSGGSNSCAVSNTYDQYQSHDRQVSQLGSRFTARCEMYLQTTPPSLDQGKLNPEFVEYMMGLPPGWVTNTGISRSQQLKMLGNGVVPQQAYYALELLGHAQDVA
jgi:DNA (cytosine-5)-methyltransferase 1